MEWLIRTAWEFATSQCNGGDKFDKIGLKMLIVGAIIAAPVAWDRYNSLSDKVDGLTHSYEIRGINAGNRNEDQDRRIGSVEGDVKVIKTDVVDLKTHVQVQDVKIEVLRHK